MFVVSTRILDSGRLESYTSRRVWRCCTRNENLPSGHPISYNHGDVEVLLRRIVDTSSTFAVAMSRIFGLLVFVFSAPVWARWSPCSTPVCCFSRAKVRITARVLCHSTWSYRAQVTEGFRQTSACSRWFLSFLSPWIAFYCKSALDRKFYLWFLVPLYLEK